MKFWRLQLLKYGVYVRRRDFENRLIGFWRVKNLRRWVCARDRLGRLSDALLQICRGRRDFEQVDKRRVGVDYDSCLEEGGGSSSSSSSSSSRTGQRLSLLDSRVSFPWKTGTGKETHFRRFFKSMYSPGRSPMSWSSGNSTPFSDLGETTSPSSDGSICQSPRRSPGTRCSPRDLVGANSPNRQSGLSQECKLQSENTGSVSVGNQISRLAVTALSPAVSRTGVCKSTKSFSILDFSVSACCGRGLESRVKPKPKALPIGIHSSFTKEKSDGTGLWADEHCPTTLSTFLSQTKAASRLQKLLSEGFVPNLLIQGPRGVGKRTLVKAVLHEIYGSSVLKGHRQTKAFPVSSSKTATISVSLYRSKHHLEIDINNVGEKDDDVILGLMLEMNTNANEQRSTLSTRNARTKKVLVFHNAQKLSANGRFVLQRLMDRHESTCRIMLCFNTLPPPQADNLQKAPVLAPAQGLVSHIRGFESRYEIILVKEPEIDELVNILQDVARKEVFNLPPEFATRIAIHSRQNIRQALVSLQACKVQTYPFKDDQTVQLGYWEQDVVKIAASMITNPSLRQLFNVRPKIHDLIQQCVPPELILQRLNSEFLSKLQEPMRNQICHYYEYFDSRMAEGPDPAFELEGFLAKFITIFKQHMRS